MSDKTDDAECDALRVRLAEAEDLLSDTSHPDWDDRVAAFLASPIENTEVGADG